MLDISYTEVVSTLTLLTAAFAPFLSAKFTGAATIKASEITKEATLATHKWDIATKNLKHLAENVAFYHDLEAEYLEELSKLSGKSVNSLKQSFRKQVKVHPSEGVLSAGSARGILGSIHQLS